MVYAIIVRNKVRNTFEQINLGNYAAMVAGLSDEFEYVFRGEHALGGRRVTKEAMNRWWERTLSVLPGAKFDVQEVLVNGGPWKTRIAVRSLVSGPLPDGERYENTVFQFMTLTWGKVTAVETVEDLQILERALKKVADAGNPEAAAPPING
ncbi:hypothetical protein SRABI76_01953 [Microbacterium oxydans]|uniref:SnoaL-like domain protein n=1 Tax=Microbacterium oxydans TaxID=82380 RepID=A0A0F0L7Y4_9MICO|nr:nuclear transport factor 2 family protein [Microbacterium oxydans]KJL29238.1 SnoaL-like domain protein [Microbacterium oxydans]CAH0198424.1 hypothetical protein SRABI76_01953 [Microbacterium oxydans]